MKDRFVRYIGFVLLFGMFLSFAGDCRAASPAKDDGWRGAVFDDTKAEHFEDVGADLSHLEEGYAAFRAKTDKKLKIQISRGESKYNYDLPGNEKIVVCPMNMGNGSYTIRVLENISGDKYAALWSKEKEVRLADEYEPFLRPSTIVNYAEDSECVALAKELTKKCDTDVETVSVIYNYLVSELHYDNEKAKTVKSGYLPDPDSVLKEKKGICFDYASLAASMLRSLGIPCRLITGYVEPDGVYHAWNEIYLKEKGWITIKIKVKGMIWKHVDITFASNGVSPAKTDDDSLYTKRYIY